MELKGTEVVLKIHFMMSLMLMIGRQPVKISRI